MDFSERVAHAYFFAKQYVINKGYAAEIDWQNEVDYSVLTEQRFIEEMSWVIIASGLSDKVVRKVFPLIKKAMLGFQSPSLIHSRKTKCYSDAIKIFGHKGKINAILYIAEYLHGNSFEIVKDRLIEGKIEFIQTFPYMGKATAYHFAKNIGIDIAKPDRHLVRISQSLGFPNPQELCELISDRISEKVSLVDLVLWRYSTLDRNYLEKINWYVNK
jgi:hypothetical protein